MPELLEPALTELEQVERLLVSLDPRDFASTATLLAKREVAIREIGTIAARSSASVKANLLRRLEKSAAAGAALRTRFLVELAALREEMASSQRLRSLSKALAPAQADPQRRLRCSG
jgi:hypothetical protein